MSLPFPRKSIAGSSSEDEDEAPAHESKRDTQEGEVWERLKMAEECLTTSVLPGVVQRADVSFWCGVFYRDYDPDHCAAQSPSPYTRVKTPLQPDTAIGASEAPHETTEIPGPLAVSPAAISTPIPDKKKKKYDEEDDMIFYVREGMEEKEQEKESGDFVDEGPVYARRRGAGNIPYKKSPLVDWEKTFLLNLVTHTLTYKISILVCQNETEEANSDSICLRRVSKSVYASPMQVKITSKSDEMIMGWPNIFFSVIDFDDAWKDISLHKKGEFIVVDLSASGDFFDIPIKNVSIFRGGLGYSILQSVHSSSSTTFGGVLLGGVGSVLSLLSRNTIKIPQPAPKEQNVEIRGPKGKGKVELSLFANGDEMQCKLKSVFIHFELIIEELFKKISHIQKSKKH
eukprot:TRINITY_DN7950_c0_g1_i1.p1 TRINITY_DN7950_c0_g1~~TRINITY_DN7950_c0_g1_i1.p1  ORF type:complete len:400 (-),score=85.19 TRINITY_DN7950_c0_g1_i1:350-1549(-)